MKIFKLAFIPLALSALGGCAVYGPPVAYDQQPYYQAAPVYAQPVYAAPQPVYVQPPVSFGLHYGYWRGPRWHRGYRH